MPSKSIFKPIAKNTMEAIKPDHLFNNLDKYFEKKPVKKLRAQVTNPMTVNIINASVIGESI